MAAQRTGERWITRGVLGIVLATFLSDFGHEMATATLPMYLVAVGATAAALGFIEGLADLLYSLSKFAGGWVGHHVRKKRPLATAGFVVTALGTAAIALTQSVAAMASARSAAWVGRGFRGPLRDFMLADEVEPRYFGRAYGVERAADMLGAVAGPLVAALLIWQGVDFRTVILLSIIPATLAAASFFSMTRDRRAAAASGPAAKPASGRLPRKFWLFTAGVGIFGVGDFSRTFLIFLAAAAFGEASGSAPGAVSLAVLLYAAHNVISALAAYPAGWLGDRRPKVHVLIFGYALGVATNVMLAFSFGLVGLLVGAIALSGIYIAIQETIEKAAVAEMLPQDQRSLGLGVLATANAVGDMISSIGVGLLLAAGLTKGAFLVPAAFGAAGTLWMAAFAHRLRPVAA
ncbi:MAG: MFS transporter [Planctomycetes bacterium]|nr:MFS transporter [Planctomycetota bacterium]MCL4730068.1 MFS transporter [Planctomycetota bacterium]